MVDRKVWVAAVALAAFGGSLVSGFHFDDYGMLQDPAVSTRGGWASCWGLYETRPLTWFSFWLNDRISGRSPMLWHAANLALHVGCALLLYRILSRLIPGAALFAALLHETRDRSVTGGRSIEPPHSARLERVGRRRTVDLAFATAASPLNSVSTKTNFRADGRAGKSAPFL